MLTPPEAFGCVEDGVYRCSSINHVNLQFIKTLGLGVIVSLNADRPSKLLRNYSIENTIELVHLGIQPWRSVSDWRLLGKEILQDTLTYVLDKRNHPILIMDGTNAFVGILRHIQKWTYSSIVAEYRVFAGLKAHYMTEIFLEMVDLKCISHEEAAQRRKSIEREQYRRKSLTTLTPTPSQPAPPPPPKSSSSSSNSQIVLHTPPDDVLPDWFIRQRALWEHLPLPPAAGLCPDPLLHSAESYDS